MADALTFFEAVVQDPGGPVVAGALCEIRRRDGKPFEGFTDEDGTQVAPQQLRTNATGSTGWWVARGPYEWRVHRGEEVSDWKPVDVSPAGDGTFDPAWLAPEATQEIVNQTITTIIETGGAEGPKGDKGDPGNPGAPGDDGRSAYQVWLDAGNVGTADDFIASLKGPKGDKGDKGDPGEPGADGVGGGGGGSTSGARVVRGVVNADGTRNRGTGFSVVRVGLGDYTVTFDTAFDALPVIDSQTTSFAGSEILAVTDDTFRVVTFNPASGNNVDTQFHFTAQDAVETTVAGEVVTFDSEVTNQAQVVVNVDPTVKAYEFEIDGIVAAGVDARWLSILPNGDHGTNAVNGYMRTNLSRFWTDPNATPGAQGQWFFERGMVMAAMRYGGDTVFMSKGRVRIAPGAPRVCDAESSLFNMDHANVNESSKHLALTRWDNYDDDVTTLVFDFGGGTFTGTIKVVTG